jgi:uncharacterized protein YukJ
MIFSGFLHQYNWLSRHIWNIVESDVKNHKPVNIIKKQTNVEIKFSAHEAFLE